MELVTSIICPGLNKSRISLVDLNNIPTDLTDNSEKFIVRITMIGRCKKLQKENRCNLTNKECVFGGLPVSEIIDFEESDYDDNKFYGLAEY